jgi:hypothetical protein
MSKDSEQEFDGQDESNAGPPTSKGLNLGPLGNLNQVVKALSKTIRAMADGSIATQDGARICNGLGIMRACLETVTLERIEKKLEQLEGQAPIYGNTRHDNQTFRSH